MKVFRKMSFADSTGDAIPFYHDGTYHIFSLTPAPGTTVYPARLRTTYSHAVSKDLVHWEELETALCPGEGDEPDASGCWTGAACYGEGRYHIFYTGYNLQNEYQQTICHATSSDGAKWSKDPRNPIIEPKTGEYEPLDWRDPYVFYNEDDGCWWLLLSARKSTGPATRRGCVVLYRSRDLKDWTYYGPIYAPYHTNCPECAEMWKEGGRWYLSYSRFSEHADTVYRVANSPFGPWRTPKMDGIGGRRFYAAKSMKNDEGRRFYFAWAHDRAEGSDTGEWYWGGLFCIPHEVVAAPGGELRVKMPGELAGLFDTPLAWEYEQVLGCGLRHGPADITLDAPGTLGYGFFDVHEKSFLFQCKIRPCESYDHLGIVLKSDRELSRCLMLQLEVGMQRACLLDLPQDADPFWQQSCQSVLAPKSPGPDGPRVAEKPFAFADGDVIDVKVAVENDMVEVFLGERVAFTFRSYAESEYEVGLMAQDAKAEFFDIRFSK